MLGLARVLCKPGAPNCLQENRRLVVLDAPEQLEPTKTSGWDMALARPTIRDYQSGAHFPRGAITQDTFNIQNVNCLLLISLWKCQYFVVVLHILGEEEARKKCESFGDFSMDYCLQRSSAYNGNLQVLFTITINKLPLNQGSAVWT